MQFPLIAAEIVDRANLASALTGYGTSALTELTSPPVLAIYRLAIAEAGRSTDMGKVLDEAGREPNRKSLHGLLAKAQSAGLLGHGDPDAMAGQFFFLVTGDLLIRLLLGVARRPSPNEIKCRAQAATDALLALHAPQVDVKL